MNMRMKKIIGLVLALVMVMGAMPIGTIKAYAAEGDVAINETTFPDATFREYIKKFDTDGDGTLSQDERNKVEEIIVVKQKIKSLKGIEHFPELWKIKCEENKLSEIDVSRNKNLLSLNCSENNLKSLDVSQNTALYFLSCSKNQLTELDVSHNPNLESLYCTRNLLKALNVKANTKLTDLDCSTNQLSELDVSNNPALMDFKCKENQLKELDVSKNKELTSLDCSNNQLENLDVKENTKLQKLWCSDNSLTKLDVNENTALLHLDCSTNKLKVLDVSRCPEIYTLMCYVNELDKLDVSKNEKLEWLGCFNNQLTELDVSKNTELAKFDADNNPLTSVILGSNDYSQKKINPFYSIEVPKGVSEIKFPKGFDTSKIEGSIAGIKINEGSLEWDEKTEKAEFKYKLCDKPEEIVTISVEFDKKDNPDLEAAKELVQKAENKKTEENYKTAKVKVDKLLKGSGKADLEGRLEKVEKAIKEKAAIDEATTLVVKAETDKTQDAYDAAKAKVDKLSDGNDKQALQGRLEKVEKAIKEKAAIDEATTLVAKAEKDKTQENYDAAKSKVEALQESKDKQALQGRLAEVAKAIEEKKETDEALDELKKAKDELDKTIKDAVENEKPSEAVDKGYDASDAADTVIKNKGKDPDGKDMTSEQIKDLVDKIKEENRLLRLPVIQVAINTAINDGNSIVLTTNPGRCKVTITILRSDRSEETYNLETGPEGTGSKTLEKVLKSGDRVKVNATRITEDRPDPDYLDNYTSKRI